MFRTWLKNNHLENYSFSHPLFPPASDRKFWEDVTNVDLIVAGEEYLGYEWPMIRATHYLSFHSNGDRLAQETPHFARREALLKLFLAELAEYQGRFLPDICDGIFAICEECFWGVSAHLYFEKHYPGDARMKQNIKIDLFAAETASLLSLILCTLRKELDAFFPGFSGAVEYELDTRIIQPYLTRRDHHWIRENGPNNWNPWIITNILTTFLVCDVPKEDFYRGLELMLQEINLFYDVQLADGGCVEGSGYWIVAGAMLHEFCHCLYTASNGAINFYHDPRLREIGLYITRVYIGSSRFAQFGDGSSQIGNVADACTAYAFGKLLGEPLLCSFAATWLKAQPQSARISRGSHARGALWSLVYEKELIKQPDFVPECSNVLPILENAFMRSGNWYYAVRGGKVGYSHSHNDVAGFMVYESEEPVLIDPGVEVYSKQHFSPYRYDIWTMQTGWHNLVVINGVEQQHDLLHGADKFDTNGTHTTVSFAEAYPPEAGLKIVVRELYAHETGINLEDRFVFDKPQNNVTENFITLLKPDVTDAGIVLGGQYVLNTDAEHTASIEYKSFEGDSRMVGSWGTEGLYRIQMHITCGREATVKVTIRKTEE